MGELTQLIDKFASMRDRLLKRAVELTLEGKQEERNEVEKKADELKRLIEALKDIQPRIEQALSWDREKGRRVSQDALIPDIIQVLGRHGGKLRKAQVEQEIYQMHRNIFGQPWYQGTVSHGIPRWKHFIAWAKERAKHQGFIESPDQSGRGYWELTQKGREYQQRIVKNLASN